MDREVGENPEGQIGVIGAKIAGFRRKMTRDKGKILLSLLPTGTPHFHRHKCIGEVSFDSSFI